MVAVIGLIMIALTGTDREDLLSPGPLTFQHSVVGGCAGCHQNFDDGPAGWVVTAFGGTPDGHAPDGHAPDGHGSDSACHTCHALGADAERAHSRPPAQAAALTEAAWAYRAEHNTVAPLKARISGWLFTDADAPHSSVSCSTCHREHRGVEADLTEMPEGACQSCHTVQFASFGNGHPEFDKPLFERRPRIAFDHAAHLDRHFGATESAGKAPETCSTCHLPSDDGRAMLTGSFETMCASCHLDDIAGAGAIGPKGIAFLTVPGLDLKELEVRGVDIGTWPKWSEEPLTPFMRHLLASEPEAAAAMDRLDGIDLLDLRDAAPQDIRAVATVAFAVKRLIGDLLANGVQAAKARLGGGDQTGALLGHLPMEVLAASANDWFPELASELARPLPVLPEPIPGPANAQNDAAAPASAPDQSDILAAPSADQSDILAAPAPDQSGILAVPAPDQSDILAVPETSGGLETFPAPQVPASEALAPPPDTAPTQPVRQTGLPALPKQVESNVSAEEWMRAGGWYRGEFALRYRPTGHADPLMQAWTDKAAAEQPEQGSSRLMAVFGNAQAPGTCLRCHSIDRVPSADNGSGEGAGSVNWSPKGYGPAVREFVRFAHAPHFSLIAESGGCQTCHTVTRPEGAGSTTAFQDQYGQGDPHAAVISGFSQPTVATCSGCHAPGRAGDSCTQCHAYHVGIFPTPTIATRMQILTPGQ